MPANRTSALRWTRTIVPLLLALVWALGTSSVLLSQDQALGVEKRAKIEKAVSAFMTAGSVPGVSVAVVQHGQPIWSAGFGMSDLEDFTPATSSTLYRLGSISKPITAVAVLQLFERGKLDLDAPVQKYCPAFPQKDSPITSRQLLAHLGCNPPLHPGRQGRRARRQRPPFRHHGGIAAAFCRRPAGRQARHAIPLLHLRLHAPRLRPRRRLLPKVRRLRPRKRPPPRRYGAHPSRRLFRHCSA